MTRRWVDSLAVLRLGLAAVVVVDLLSFLFVFIGDARAVGIANGTLNPFNDLVSQTPARAGIALLGVAGAVAFARRPGRIWAGLVALIALALLSAAHAQLFGSPFRHLYYSGLCLAGWLLGLAVTRQRGSPNDESYARMGSIALLASAYLNAGISKIVYGGPHWLAGMPIQEIIVGQDGLVPDGLLSVYRIWAAATPAALALFSVATMVVELAAPLMLVGRRARVAVTLGLFAMHANILLLTDILYWESMVFLLLFGLSPDPPAQAAPDPAAARPARSGLYVATVALLAVCALLGILHQGRRFVALQAARPQPGEVLLTGPATQPPPPGGAAPAPAEMRQIGPFTVGRPLGEGWTIDAVEIRDDGILTRLSGTPGRVAFEMTCAASDRTSPFDLGAAHIFYSSALEFHTFEAAGWAVRAEVEKAAQGGDVCAQVASWKTAAQAGQPR